MTPAHAALFIEKLVPAFVALPGIKAEIAVDTLFEKTLALLAANMPAAAFWASDSFKVIGIRVGSVMHWGSFGHCADSFHGKAVQLATCYESFL